jgi:hypothetical protein
MVGWIPSLSNMSFFFPSSSYDRQSELRVRKPEHAFTRRRAPLPRLQLSAVTGPHREPDEYDLLARDLDVVSIVKGEFDDFVTVDLINVMARSYGLGAWHHIQRFRPASPT